MLVLENIHFKYKEPLIKNIYLQLAPGSLMALTGASGSGKSTLLKLIYGSLGPDKGSIYWKKTPLLGPDYNLVPGAPFLRYLAQDFDLMPFTTVYENISQHLSVFDLDHLDARTLELLKLIDMEAFAKTPVKNLSGGQQQRVAIAKVLAKTPELILLDEPFSHIDPPLKLRLRAKLFDYLKTHHIACILASHHPEDYLGHAHEIVCMDAGEITAHGSPEDLYNRPPSVGVAKLFGHVNALDKETAQKIHPSLEIKSDQELIIWPHEWRIGSQKGLAVRLNNQFFKGNGYLLALSTHTGQILYAHSKKAYQKGQALLISVNKTLCKARLSALVV